jgi:hypothetical protein
MVDGGCGWLQDPPPVLPAQRTQSRPVMVDMDGGFVDGGPARLSHAGMLPQSRWVANGWWMVDGVSQQEHSRWVVADGPGECVDTVRNSNTGYESEASELSQLAHTHTHTHARTHTHTHTHTNTKHNTDTHTPTHAHASSTHTHTHIPPPHTIHTQTRCCALIVITSAFPTGCKLSAGLPRGQ